ncbi:MAG: phosphotransferase [Burkholderiaceae bacterium]|nr:phosphotransferase [Burkholderiaceae bacterium]
MTVNDPSGARNAAAPTVAWGDPDRHAAFERWLAPLAAAHGLRVETLRPASADASFRRYLRIDASGGPSLIVMDAPPPQEDVRPFVHVATLIGAAGLHGPRVLASDVERGFLLLDDLGHTLYLDALREASAAQADALMRDAIRALVQWQLQVPAAALPPFTDALLERDLALFPEWCVQREFGVNWTSAQQDTWQRVCQQLVARAQAQPRVAVHRDWMPRNLMVADPNPAILDFQDAVAGPIAYDMASLLRDAFISWDEEREIDWAVRYWEAARRATLPVADDFGEFWRQLEWIGLQRHLKVLGIFCRLKHRDGKAQYSEDLPRFFAYATRVATRYRELQPLLALIEPLSGIKPVRAFSMR